jgi:hypothetical protein
MNATEQINALVEKFGLSETVKQEIIKIMQKACDDAYDKGQDDYYDAIRMD